MSDPDGHDLVVRLLVVGTPSTAALEALRGRLRAAVEDVVTNFEPLGTGDGIDRILVYEVERVTEVRPYAKRRRLFR